MGGMQVLQFISNFPDKAKTVIPIACTSSHSAQNIAFNELGRQAIAADSNWNEGNYIHPKILYPIKVWQLQEWLLISHIFQKKAFKKNLEENYKKEKILNLDLMLIFKLKVT